MSVVQYHKLKHIQDTLKYLIQGSHLELKDALSGVFHTMQQRRKYIGDWTKRLIDNRKDWKSTTFIYQFVSRNQARLAALDQSFQIFQDLMDEGHCYYMAPVAQRDKTVGDYATMAKECLDNIEFKQREWAEDIAAIYEDFDTGMGETWKKKADSKCPGILGVQDDVAQRIADTFRFKHDVVAQIEKRFRRKSGTKGEQEVLNMAGYLTTFTRFVLSSPVPGCI
jgi:hypothetical protein